MCLCWALSCGSSHTVHLLRSSTCRWATSSLMNLFFLKQSKWIFLFQSEAFSHLLAYLLFQDAAGLLCWLQRREDFRMRSAVSPATHRPAHVRSERLSLCCSVEQQYLEPLGDIGCSAGLPSCLPLMGWMRVYLSFCMAGHVFLSLYDYLSVSFSYRFVVSGSTCARVCQALVTWDHILIGVTAAD